MELDQERSGHFKENILSLVFTGVSSDIGIELNSEKATELLQFLIELIEVPQSDKKP